MLFVEGPKKKARGAGHPRSWVREAAGRLRLGSGVELDSWSGSCGHVEQQQVVGPRECRRGDVTGGAVRGMAENSKASAVSRARCPPGS